MMKVINARIKLPGIEPNARKDDGRVCSTPPAM